MKLAVFGATGATGRQVVSQALDAGHEVTAFVRDPAAFPVRQQRLRVVEGDITKPGPAIDAAVRGQQAVVSALGRGKGLRSGSLMQAGLKAIAEAMQRQGVRRLLVVSALGVGDTRRDTPMLPRLLQRLFLSDIFADKQAAEAELRSRDLDWTLVHPSLLTDGPLTGRYRAGERLSLSGMPKVSRANVAHFILAELQKAEFVRRSALISE